MHGLVKAWAFTLTAVPALAVRETSMSRSDFSPQDAPRAADAPERTSALQASSPAFERWVGPAAMIVIGLAVLAVLVF
jgi:hypothetical protein